MFSTFPPQYIVYVENLLKTLWKTLWKCGKLCGKPVEMLKTFSTNYPQIVEKSALQINKCVKLCKFTQSTQNTVENVLKHGGKLSVTLLNHS